MHDRERDALVNAVTQRAGWAETILGSDEWNDIEKIWVRRYEMDVRALVGLVEELRSEIDDAYYGS